MSGIFSIFESSEGLFHQDVRTILDEIVAEVDALEPIVFSAMQNQLTENQRREFLGHEFGTRTNYLQTAGIVEHTVDGSTRELALDMSADLASTLHSNDGITAHLDKMLEGEDTNVSYLAQRAKDLAQPSVENIQGSHLREVA